MYISETIFQEFIAETNGPAPTGRPDLFDRLEAKHGWSNASQMWDQMCDEYDYIHSDEFEEI